MATPVPVRARRSRSPMNGKELASIIWVLAEEGDINETHAGGNATRTLTQRLTSRGMSMDSKTFQNRLRTLENRGWIDRLVKSHTTYALRLKVSPELAGPNPFEKRVVGRPRKTELDVGAFHAGSRTKNGNGNDPHDGMTIRARLDFAMELIAGIKQDLDQINI